MRLASKPSWLSRWVRWALGGACLIAVVFLGIEHKDEFAPLFRQVSLLWVGVLIGLQVLWVGLGGLSFWSVARTLGNRVSAHQALGLSYIANAMNQLLPYRPGLAFRCLYLKHHTQMSLKDFSFITLLMLLAQIGLNAPWLFHPAHQAYELIIEQTPTWVGVGLVIMFVAIVGLLGFAMKSGFTWVAHYLEQFKRYWAQKPALILSLSLFVLTELMALATIALLFLALGHPIGMLDALFFAALRTLSLIIPVTPSNLGVLELVFATFTEILFGQFTLGVTVIVLWRVLQLLVAMTVGPAYCLLLLGRFFPKTPSIEA